MRTCFAGEGAHNRAMGPCVRFAWLFFPSTALALGASILAERTFGEPKLVCELKDPAINEASGVARSYKLPGRYYTHNDSGDTARFWRFDLKGRLEGPWTLKGAEAIDWEDMASAKIGGRAYLYFADIGDNALKRKSVQVYRVEEPGAVQGEIAKVDRFDLTYPDKPHNAEAFMVHPKTGEFVIVTKVMGEAPQVFGLDGGKAPGKYRLALRGTIPLQGPALSSQLITGGDISADGRHVVIRNYISAQEFPAEKRLTGWYKSGSKLVVLRPERQGEAICYSLDGKRLITASEGAPCPVSIMPLRSN